VASGADCLVCRSCVHNGRLVSCSSGVGADILTSRFLPVD
jgi:hypothetical protein